MFDPRSIANLILIEAQTRALVVTNLSLQKILYFVHGRYLIERGEPLISGNFEAWKYGPVCLPVYEAFKAFGSSPIDSLATKRDIKTGKVVTVAIPSDVYLQRYVVDLAVPYLSLSPGRLVELSHARGSPWDRVTQAHEQTRLYGLRMSNDCIANYFKFHKVAVRVNPRVGEPNEESPPDGN